MKTAVVISGQARTFARTFPNLKWQVFSKLENPHFFVSVANDADAASVYVLRDHYPADRVHIEVVDQPVLPEPPIESTFHAPYAITPTRTPGVGPLQGILRQLWHNSRAYKFAMQNGADGCDMFVRCRPDLQFARFRRERPIMEDGALTPYWGRYGMGINDRFAILGTKAAKVYFETYDALPALLAAGIPFHPETLVGEALAIGKCWVGRTLLAEFSMLRRDGTFEHMQCLPGELAEWTAHLSRQ